MQLAAQVAAQLVAQLAAQPAAQLAARVRGWRLVAPAAQQNAHAAPLGTHTLIVVASQNSWPQACDHLFGSLRLCCQLRSQLWSKPIGSESSIPTRQLAGCTEACTAADQHAEQQAAQPAADLGLHYDLYKPSAVF